jgi:hypothetical protein
MHVTVLASASQNAGLATCETRFTDNAPIRSPQLEQTP